MTRQIADATEVMERNQQQLENAKTYLESILSNLTSGVLTFDERLYVKTMNTAGARSSAWRAAPFHGLKLPEWPRHVQSVAPFAEIALRHFASAGTKQWEEQMEYRGPTARARCCLRGTRWASAATTATWWCSTTSPTSSRRSATPAWGEVARRLAHEIKNPLTRSSSRPSACS
jgi:nitrogen fixation/metabolism regulation signal transduction histidine kinase